MRRCYMGKIHPIPKEICYKYPKASKKAGQQKGKIVARAWIDEPLDTGTYRRILDLIIWSDGKPEVRFCYYYQKIGGNETDWMFGRSAANLKPSTLRKLLKRAKENPQEGDFGEYLNFNGLG